MRVKCNECGNLVDSNNVVIESVGNMMTGNYVFFYCDECYKKKTEQKPEDRSKPKSWKW